MGNSGHAASPSKYLWRGCLARVKVRFFSGTDSVHQETSRVLNPTLGSLSKIRQGKGISRHIPYIREVQITIHSLIALRCTCIYSKTFHKLHQGHVRQQCKSRE